MSLPRYAECKDSGLAWLGDVPANWAVKRLRFVADFNPSKREVVDLAPDTEVSFLPMDAIGDDGKIKVEQTRALSEVETGYTYFSDGDVVVAKITPCFENGKGAVVQGLLGGVGFGTTELIVARPRRDSSFSDYLHWIFVSATFRKQAEGAMYGAGGQKRVPDDYVRDFAMPFPPLHEQTAIATFLDRETGKIDALIAAQERLQTLLAEKRRATISHAVTRGLDREAPMKDSGVAWLGKVPAHWETFATKRLFRLVAEPASDDNDEELLSIYTDIGVRPRKSLEAKGNKATTTDGYWIVRKGDIIVNKLLAWMGAIGLSNYDGVTSPAYDILRQTKPLNPQYYDYLFRCGIMFSEFRRYSRGIMDMRLRLYFEEFGQIYVPFPSEQEQTEIVRFLQNETSKLDTLNAETERAIQLLKERRSALIAAAVTGKIDVREQPSALEAAA